MRDLCWVADELAKLHQDLQEIRVRQAAAEAALSSDIPDTSAQQDHTEAKVAQNGDGSRAFDAALADFVLHDKIQQGEVARDA